MVSGTPSATAGHPTWRAIIGWVAVGSNAATACLWAFWSSIEAFHEGWWHDSLTADLLWTLLYLVPVAIFVCLGLIGVRWPRVGAIVILAFTVWFWWWWNVPSRLADSGNILVGLAMSGVGGLFAALWWFGRPQPRRWAFRATWIPPLLVAIAFGAAPAWRVVFRVDDGDRGERRIEGNGVALIWAPQGPGWPGRSASWHEAMNIAAHLSQAGSSLRDTPQDFWRLPTRDELVRSMVHHGRNAGGSLNPATGEASYRVWPDKETPLWNPRSEVIYFWTADEVDDKRAWSITYTGALVRRDKSAHMGTLGFRLVKR